MLPRGDRLVDSAEFRRVTRRGSRSSAASLVVHVSAEQRETDGPRSVGFVVSKAVGPAVTRNRVKRRLRHLMAGRLNDLPAGTSVVVRALPAAAQARDLGPDLDRTLAAALRREHSRVTA